MENSNRVFYAKDFDPATIIDFLKSQECDFFVGKEIKSVVPTVEICSQVFDFTKNNDLAEKIFKTINYDEINLRFKQCTINGTLIFQDLVLDNLSFEHCSFTENDFVNNTKKINSIEFNRVSIKSISIEKCVVDAPILFAHCQHKEIQILSSIIGGGVNLINLNDKDTKIHINKVIGSILLPKEKTDFISCDKDSLIYLSGNQKVSIKVKEAR
jgi:hypothetical protein